MYNMFSSMCINFLQSVKCPIKVFTTWDGNHFPRDTRLCFDDDDEGVILYNPDEEGGDDDDDDDADDEERRRWRCVSGWSHFRNSPQKHLCTVAHNLRFWSMINFWRWSWSWKFWLLIFYDLKLNSCIFSFEFETGGQRPAGWVIELSIYISNSQGQGQEKQA